MARTRTLAQLRADVRYRADIEGETDRHPDANLTRLINESWQALREIVSDNGHEYYLTKSSPASMSTTASSAGAFVEVDMPTDAVRVYGIDIQVDGKWVSLEPVSFGQRTDFQDALWNFGSTSGVPYGFHIYQTAQESTTTTTTGKIAIFPTPDEAYTYVIWYLPSWTDVTSDTYVFNGIAGWEEWVIWDVTAKILTRDNDARNSYAMAIRERDTVLARILQAVPRIQRAGPGKRIDVRSRSRSRREINWWR